MVKLHVGSPEMPPRLPSIGRSACDEPRLRPRVRGSLRIRWSVPHRSQRECELLHTGELAFRRIVRRRGVFVMKTQIALAIAAICLVALAFAGTHAVAEGHDLACYYPCMPLTVLEPLW